MPVGRHPVRIRPCRGGLRVDRFAAMMTVQDVARYLRVHTITVYRMVQRGRIPAIRVGRVWRFRKDHIDRWLVSHGNGGHVHRPAQRAGPPGRRRKA